MVPLDAHHISVTLTRHHFNNPGVLVGWAKSDLENIQALPGV